MDLASSSSANALSSVNSTQASILLTGMPAFFLTPCSSPLQMLAYSKPHVPIHPVMYFHEKFPAVDRRLAAVLGVADFTRQDTASDRRNRLFHDQHGSSIIWIDEGRRAPAESEEFHQPLNCSLHQGHMHSKQTAQEGPSQVTMLVLACSSAHYVCFNAGVITSGHADRYGGQTT